MPAVTLSQKSLVSVEGPDAESLLQNVITTDLSLLQPDEAKAGAILTPQGKILFDFVVSRAPNGGFLLETNKATADDLIRRLMLYRLRAKAAIAAAELDVEVAWDSEADGGLTDRRFRSGPRLARHYVSASAAGEAEAEAYTRLRIRSGVAESGSDFAPADVFPHDVLFDLNEGVSFRKGCFVGQEVVSRMQHRGTARRRLVIVEGETSLEEAARVEAGGHTVGDLGSVAGKLALAIVRTDRVAEALGAGEAVTAGGQPVRLSFPAWTGLGFAAALPGAGQA
ncbi:MAG: CAF17-like 4Fe-4S cluster assembly/insertion protein YgfZ [Pararhizobium sp.]